MCRDLYVPEKKASKFDRISTGISKILGIEVMNRSQPIEINIWKRNSTVKNFPIRTEFRSVFNAFDQSFDQFYCLFFSVEFLFHIFISMSHFMSSILCLNLTFLKIR
jgi:hypothetical protein